MVEWVRANWRYHVLADVGTQTPAVTIDGRGDAAWTGGDGYTVVRLASGAVHELHVAGPDVARYISRYAYPTAASDHYFWAGVSDAIYAWNVGPRLADGPTVGHAVSASEIALVAGPRGDLITGNFRPTYLRTAGGARTPMPATATGVDANMLAIDRLGTTAFTAHSDRRIHFLRCH